MPLALGQCYSILLFPLVANVSVVHTSVSWICDSLT